MQTAKHSKALLLGVLLVSMAGCATAPKKLPATYISPMLYKDYDCEQLAFEQSRVERRTNDLYFSLKKEADKDSAQMGIGLVLFWPALLFLEGGDGPEAAEYSRLKGEYVALEEVSLMKKCQISFAKDLDELLVESDDDDAEDDQAEEEVPAAE